MSAAWKVRDDLGVEIDPVHHDQHRGVLQRRMQPQLLRGEDHQQRLARPLEVPDQPLLRPPGDDPLDDLVGALVLLVAADDLDACACFLSVAKAVKLARMSSTTFGRSIESTASSMRSAPASQCLLDRQGPQRSSGRPIEP